MINFEMTEEQWLALRDEDAIEEAHNRECDRADNLYKQERENELHFD